uniref:G-protein coupled receptors family 2 profile 2 domain-containing protein n=1 Tax=Octopus bimaculoides TaxID=37653 RepID=A0A0L8HEX5_OCTBM
MITNFEDGSLQGLSNLQNLLLEDNKINNIEGAFKGLVNLRILELRNNNITTIDEGSFQSLSNLKELYMDRNKISNIDKDGFKGLYNLKELRLVANKIVTIDGRWFQDLSNLTSLNLGYNEIIDIENGSFKNLDKLEELDLRGNGIKNNGNGSWEQLRNLKKLKLANNQISNIEKDSFKYLDSLEELDLSGNRITNIGSDSWQHLQNLKKLNLRNNQIKEYQDGAFSSLSNITGIDLRNNKDMVCGCHLPDLIERISKADNRNVTVLGYCIEAGTNHTKLTHTQKPSQCKSHTINYERIQCHVCSEMNCRYLTDCHGIQPRCMTTIAMHGDSKVEKTCSTRENCTETERRNVSNCNNWTKGNSCVTCCNTGLCNENVFEVWTSSFQLYLLYKRQGNKNENLTAISKELEKKFLHMPGIYTVKNCGAQSKTEVFILECHVPKNVTKEQVKDILKAKALRSLGFEEDSEISDRKFCNENTNGRFQWPVTKIGDTAYISCLAHIATRDCVQGTAATTCLNLPKQSPFTGVWKDVDISQCNNTKWIIKELKKMQGHRINECNIKDLTRQLLNISQKSVYFKEIDVVLAVANYEKIVPCISNVSANAIKDDILSIINNIINTPEKILIGAEKSNRSVSRILNIMGNVSEKLQVEKQQFKVLFSKFGMGITKVNKNTFRGLFYGILPATNTTEAENVISDSPYPNDKKSRNMMDYISIPKTLSKHLKNSNRISFYSMPNDKLFRVIQRSGDGKNSKPESFINSRIITANIPKQPISDLENPISMSFNLLYKNGSNSRCVFWDDTPGHNPHWSTSGCKTERKEKVYCSCNHLTSFAILTDVDQNVKSYFICYIGCGISLFFLILTIIVHAHFKNLWKITPSKILVNLCGSLAITHLIVLVGMRPGKTNAICKGVAILLHYFLIASAMWITVEALHICQALIATFRACQRSFMMKSSIFAWGVPGIILMLTLIITKTNSYIRITTVCWLSQTPFYVSFLFPMGLILVFSLIVLLLIIGRLFSMKKEKKCEQKTRKFRLFGIVSVLFLFGASWALAFYTFFGGGATVLIYICAIFHALQGLFIFIFYCACDKHARNVICSNSCHKKKYVLNKDSQNNSGENPDNETGVKYRNSEDKIAEVKL